MINSPQPHESHAQQFSRSQRPEALCHQAQGDAANQRLESFLEHLTTVFLTLDRTWHVTYLSHQTTSPVSRPAGQLARQDVLGGVS